MNKKMKIYFSNNKRPTFNRITQASKEFFTKRINNKDIDKTTWWILSYFDNKMNSTIYMCMSDRIDNDYLQELWADAIKQASKMHPEHNINISLIFDSSIQKQQKFFIEKWALLALQKDDFFKSQNEKKTNNKSNWEITIQNISNKNLITITDAIKHARELTFKPANIITPESIQQYIKNNLWNDKNISIKVFDKKDLEKENMNLFLAVWQWSTLDPKMIVMDYNPSKKKSDPIVLIWKWLTYDSGWLYAKPYPYMNEMFGDMWWAATVIWIMSALTKLWIQKRIVWIVWLTENMPDGWSYKNWDIIKSRSWKTVYVWHTDAEWRLVLADMLSYAKDNYKASLTLDFATLTWACMLALGEMYTWIFSDNQTLINKLKQISQKTNDLTWQLPLDKESKKAVKHNLADLSNTWDLKWILWASTAAAFLSNFVDDTKKWIHCDIAWTALRSQLKKSYDLPNGLWTWSMVHTILEYIK